MLLIKRYQLELDELEIYLCMKLPKKRKFWVRDIFMERKQKGEFHLLVQQAKMVDEELFFAMFRMGPSKFEELLGYVAPYITRDSTKREAIQPNERLSVTLRYLVTGDAFNTIGNSYRMSGTTVGRIVRETCDILWKVLLEKGFLNVPSTQDEWRQIAEEFEGKWNCPTCVGAMDGKHVAIQCPPRAGSMYFNYKKFHSIVLLAVVNASYEFILVDVGDYGRLSDGSVFSSSYLGNAFNTGTLNLPPPRTLGSSPVKFPYVFIGDDAFPLKPCLLKPYSGPAISLRERIAKYRLSRARRVVENTFGIATAHFRIFRRAMCVFPDTATIVTKAVIALHNYLMKDRNLEVQSRYCPHDFVDEDVDGETRGYCREEDFNQALCDTSSIGSNNYSQLAKKV